MFWNRKKKLNNAAVKGDICQCGHARCFHGYGKYHCFLPVERYELCACQTFILPTQNDPVVDELERIFTKK